jgi:hypothetical protein
VQGNELRSLRVLNSISGYLFDMKNVNANIKADFTIDHSRRLNINYKPSDVQISCTNYVLSVQMPMHIN